jgi:hypothetical protein
MAAWRARREEVTYVAAQSGDSVRLVSSMQESLSNSRGDGCGNLGALLTDPRDKYVYALAMLDNLDSVPRNAPRTPGKCMDTYNYGAAVLTQLPRPANPDDSELVEPKKKLQDAVLECFETHPDCALMWRIYREREAPDPEDQSRRRFDNKYDICKGK